MRGRRPQSQDGCTVCSTPCGITEGVTARLQLVVIKGDAIKVFKHLRDGLSSTLNRQFPRIEDELQVIRRWDDRNNHGSTGLPKSRRFRPRLGLAMKHES